MKYNRLLVYVLTSFLNLPVWVVAAGLVRGPYLQQSTSKSIVVVWRTEGESTPILRYGNTPGTLTKELDAQAMTIRVSADIDTAADILRLYKEPIDEIDQREADHDPSTVPNTYQYEAQVSGLQPGSKYFYAI